MRIALARIALALLALLLAGCPAGDPRGGSLADTARFFAPSHATFERELQPNTPANPTPHTVTGQVQGGGGAETVGAVVDLFAPGLGKLIGGIGGAAALVFAGRRVSQAQLAPALRLLMQGLEASPPEVRGWVRDRARALGISSFFEDLIARGEVPPLPPQLPPHAAAERHTFTAPIPLAAEASPGAPQGRPAGEAGSQPGTHTV